MAWRLHDKVHSFYSEHADKVGLLLNNLAQYAIMLSGFLLDVDFSDQYAIGKTIECFWSSC